jgi:hypothetical protein
MAENFFDTSAAIKHYRTELGTPRVDSILSVPGSRHSLSSLSVVETHSVLARWVRTGQLAPADFNPVSTRFFGDIAAGIWHVEPIVDADLDQARRLLIKHGMNRAMRTLDSLQLAVALRMFTAQLVDTFVCADTHLCHFASVEGLTVINPELP